MPEAPTPPPAPAPGAVVLALDTATTHLTLALRWPGGERHTTREVGRAHAETLAEATAELFAGAGLPLRADVIVVGTGPGSYTGVRVGASYALGLARAWNATVLGVSTLEALVSGRGEQAVSLDARKGNVYGAVYDVQEGTVSATLHAPIRLPLAEFEALAGSRPHHQGGVPDGLALLRAGLDHGQQGWTLSYL